MIILAWVALLRIQMLALDGIPHRRLMLYFLVFLTAKILLSLLKMVFVLTTLRMGLKQILLSIFSLLFNQQLSGGLSLITRLLFLLLAVRTLFILGMLRIQAVLI